MALPTFPHSYILG